MGVQLRGDNQTSFELQAVGYQYPHIVGDYDGNWLMMSGSVVTPTETWGFLDACLLTSEYAQLAAWFRMLDTPTPSRAMQRFIEPNLTFRYERYSDGVPLIVVEFDLECAPPSLRNRVRFDPPVSYGFPIRLNDPRAIAESIDSELMMWPRR